MKCKIVIFVFMGKFSAKYQIFSSNQLSDGFINVTAIFLVQATSLHTDPKAEFTNFRNLSHLGFTFTATQANTTSRK